MPRRISGISGNIVRRKVNYFTFRVDSPVQFHASLQWKNSNKNLHVFLAISRVIVIRHAWGNRSLDRNTRFCSWLQVASSYKGLHGFSWLFIFLRFSYLVSALFLLVHARFHIASGVFGCAWRTQKIKVYATRWQVDTFRLHVWLRPRATSALQIIQRMYVCMHTYTLQVFNSKSKRVSCNVQNYIENM